MRSPLKIAALVAATVILALLVSWPVATGQSRTGTIPRLGGKPDMNGIWQAINTANWDIQAHSAKAALAMRPGPVAGAGQRSAGVRRRRIGAGGLRGGRRRRDPVHARGAEEEAGEPGELADARSGDQVLPPRRAARHLHAVPVPDLPERHGRSSSPTSTPGRCATCYEGSRARRRSTAGWASRWAAGRATRSSSTSAGSTTRRWFDRAGNHHTEQMKVTERYTMIDAGSHPVRGDDRRSARRSRARGR